MNILGLIPDIASDTAKNLEAPVEGLASQLKHVPIDQILEKLLSTAVDFALKLVAAIIVFYVGKLIINRIHRSIKKIFIRRNVERSLSTFMLSVIKITLLFFLIIIVISILGIQTSSFIALFASAGVAIGMALSGTLQNFAGGVLILLIKPYKVGDFIEFQGFTGTVKEIQIFNTILNTPDNKCIMIPNGGLSTGSINNYSKEAYRRVDWTINLAYGDDYEVAKKAIMRIISEDDRIVKKYLEDDKTYRQSLITPEEQQKADIAAELLEKGKRKLLFFRRKPKKEVAVEENKTAIPAATLPKTDCSPFIALGALSASSIDIIVRVWTPTQYYWGVYFDLNARFYKELPEAGLNFPFPQMDIHMR